MLLEGIDEDGVDFRPNYDGGRARSRWFSPAAFPNLLANGSHRHRGRHGHLDPAA